jgi:hypothetical protein
MVEEGLQHALGDRTGLGQRAIAVLGQSAPGLHQIVQGRIGRAGVEGDERAGRCRIIEARIGEGDVADPAEIEEGNRRLGADMAAVRLPSELGSSSGGRTAS